MINTKIPLEANREVTHQLISDGIFSDKHIQEKTSKDYSLSIYHETRLIIMIGLGLISTSVGKLIYDTVQDYTILIHATLILTTFLSFLYCYKKKPAFTWSKPEEKVSLSDLILVFGTSSFITLEGYLQYKHQIFSEPYSNMAVAPTLVFLFCAYYFDNKAVLTKGLIGVAAWFSITFSEISWENVDQIFSKDIPIVPSVVIGLGALIVGFISDKYSRKSHFKATYFIFSAQLVLLALCVRLLNLDADEMGTFILLLAFGTLFFFIARHEKEFIITLTAIVYSYVGFFKVLTIHVQNEKDGALIVIVTIVPLVYYLIAERKKYQDI